ncbi:hypothetical protein GGR50DRAFT_694431 [Xylaria sp. CBS 124048]|nr:hypothetical protein GGR50DRAFT_694431 [Xylaria sp. CBS 124048]
MQQWQVGPVPEYLYSSTQHPNDMHTTHPYQPDMARRNEFAGYPTPGQNPATQPHQQHAQQQHHQQQQPHTQHQSHQPHQAHQPHAQHAQHGQQHQHAQHPSQSQHHQQHHATPVPPPINLSAPAAASSQQQSTPTQTPAQPAPRGRKRPAPGQATPTPTPATIAAPPTTASGTMPSTPAAAATPIPVPSGAQQASAAAQSPGSDGPDTPSQNPPVKKSRTNTPWTPAEELRLKQMRDAGSSWSEIAKTFPTRTEGSVKKHWYKDMHYAEFAEDESQALLNAIKDYENNKWKTIGSKVGKPAKACEQYAKEHFPDLFAVPKATR